MSTVYKVRLVNLRALIREAGGATAVAKLLDMEASQLSQIAGRTPTRNIGHKTARNIEVKFSKPEGWLDSLQVFELEQERSGEYNVTNQPLTLRRIPLLTWIQAGQWREAVKKMAREIATAAVAGPNAYALKVIGDSMTNPLGSPSFPEGTVIIVDPDLQAKPGSFVIVRQEAELECTFKQLVHDAGRRYLKPLNPRYPLIELSTGAEICGVLIQAVIDF